MKVCECCGLMQQDTQLRCCTDIDEIDVGVGVKLYFKNIANHAVIMTCAFLIYALYSLITNVIVSTNNAPISGPLCVFDGSCGLSNLSIGTKLQIGDATLIIQVIIGIVLISLWGAVTFYRRHKEKELEFEARNIRASSSDFTLMLEDFPKIYLERPYTEALKEVNRIFKEYEKQVNSVFNYEVVKINIARPMYNERA